MHHQRETHDTAVSNRPRVQPGMGFQLVPLKATALPPSGTATQTVEDTHDTATDCGCGRTAVGADHLEPLNVKAFPSASKATQKAEEVQETEVKSCFWSTVVGCDHAAPFQVRIPPRLSTAAQKRVFGQLTATRVPPTRSATTGADQVEPLNATACPLESSALHDDVDGHDTDTRGA
jgi:hypothetical protein